MGLIKEITRNISLFFVDGILVNMSFYIAYLIRFDGVIDMNAFRPYMRLWPYLSLVHIIIFYFFRLYSSVLARSGSKRGLFAGVLNSSVIGAMASMSVNYVTRHFAGFMPSVVFVLACLFNILLILGYRFFVVRKP